MSEERRQHTRYSVWFPMQLDTEAQRGHLAVSQNISRSGVLLATAVELEEGAEVQIAFQVAGDSEVRSTHARIIRVKPNAEDPDGLWPFHVGVEFVDPIPELEPLLEAARGRGFSPSSVPPPP